MAGVLGADIVVSVTTEGDVGLVLDAPVPRSHVHLLGPGAAHFTNLVVGAMLLMLKFLLALVALHLDLLQIGDVLAQSAPGLL